MSLYSDLKEVLTPYAQKIKGLATTNEEIKADLEDLDERVDVLEGGSGGSGLTDAVKTALLQLAQKVAYIDDGGQDYYDDLYNALYPPADLVSISAVYTQSGTVYDTDTLDSLKSDLVVTALMSDSTTQTVTNYTLSGTLTEGTSTITVSYGGKTATFTVTVSQYDGSIYNWDFTQSLVDSKQGATATLGSGVTRGASGLTFDGTTNAYVHLADMSNYTTSSFTVEVDVDTLVSGGTLVDLNTQSGMSDNPCGLIFSGHWYFRLTSNSNATLADSTLTDPTIFNGHTVKCQFDYTNKTWTVYNNGTLVGSVEAYQKSNGRNQLGLSANYSSRFLGNGTVITAVRVYEGVV